MAGVTIHSTRWHRVAGLQPRLSGQTQLRRQRVRGETWYLLANPVSGRSVRLNRGAYAIAARMDGRSPVQQLWDRSLQHEPETATQDEVIDLMAQLREAGLLQVDRGANFDALLPHLDKVARPRARASLLAWRLPLGNPTRLLNRLEPLPALLFSRTALWLWLLAMATLVVLALQHGPSLWAHGQRWMATPRFAMLAALLYVPIKLVHELAHGLAVRRWGGQVREAGVTLMLLMPVPYVDASAATGFAQRRARMAVSAAGIMTELALASVALPLWLWLDAGLLRDAAFVTLVVAGVSTVLFNGNPLQRLDGYYIFCDALDLPNLAPRSRAWWLGCLRRWLLGDTDTEPMVVAQGETPWLALYAPLSWLMILLIAAIAVAWIGQLSFTLGLLCAGLLAWQVLLQPAIRLLGQLRRSALGRAGHNRRGRIWAMGSAVGLLFVLLAPWPRSTVVQGVVWPSEQSQLRVDEAGFVDRIIAADGQRVQAGDVVLQLVSPQLQSDLARQAARVGALEAERVDALPGSRAFGRDRASGRAADAQADLARAQAELAQLQTRAQSLLVRSQVDGQLVLPGASDLRGQFLRRGHLLGQTLDGSAPLVRVALPENQAGQLGDATAQISVRLRGSALQQYPARLLRESPGGVMQLPSAALSTRHGGDIVTDPLDTEARKPIEPVLVFDVQLSAASAQQPGAATGHRIGERAWVRFDAGASPAVLQLAQALRTQMLRRFNPQQ